MTSGPESAARATLPLPVPMALAREGPNVLTATATLPLVDDA